MNAGKPGRRLTIFSIRMISQTSSFRLTACLSVIWVAVIRGKDDGCFPEYFFRPDNDLSVPDDIFVPVYGNGAVFFFNIHLIPPLRC